MPKWHGLTQYMHFLNKQFGIFRVERYLNPKCAQCKTFFRSKGAKMLDINTFCT